MICLKLKHSFVVNAQIEVFEQELEALQIQVIDYLQYKGTGTIEYTLTGNSKKLVLKAVSLANTLFYPYLFRVNILADPPKKHSSEISLSRCKSTKSVSSVKPL